MWITNLIVHQKLFYVLGTPILFYKYNYNHYFSDYTKYDSYFALHVNETTAWFTEKITGKEVGFNKRYFIIDLHLARHIGYYVGCFSSPTRPFYSLK